MRMAGKDPVLNNLVLATLIANTGITGGAAIADLFDGTSLGELGVNYLLNAIPGVTGALGAGAYALADPVLREQVMNEIRHAQGKPVSYYPENERAAMKMRAKGMEPQKIAESLKVNPRRKLASATLAGTLAGAIPAAMAMRDSPEDQAAEAARRQENEDKLNAALAAARQAYGN